MWQWFGLVLIAAVGITACFVIARRKSHLRCLAAQCEHGKQQFRHRREWLEAKFLTLASASGKPRGLLWKNCDFDNGITFARDRHSGELQALIAITIQFAAEQGGGMEHVEAVNRLRAATAVFQYDGANWRTQGRVVFNLTPIETIEHFRNELEPVDVR